MEYNWKIEQLKLAKTENGLDNVVKEIHWRYGLTDGSANLFLGAGAGSSITTGNSNIVLGASGTSITTGNFNTIIGSGIISLSTNLSNNIILSDGQGNIRFR